MYQCLRSVVRVRRKTDILDIDNARDWIDIFLMVKLNGALRGTPIITKT